jgi:hypothetical protein
MGGGGIIYLNINYLCTYDLYGPVRNVFDAGRYIIRASGRGLGPGNWEFLGPVNLHRADRRVPFGAQKTLALNVQVTFYLFLSASRWAGDEDITQEHAVGPAGPHLPLREHRLRQLHPYQVETGIINK